MPPHERDDYYKFYFHMRSREHRVALFRRNNRFVYEWRIPHWREDYQYGLNGLHVWGCPEGRTYRTLHREQGIDNFIWYLTVNRFAVQSDRV